MMANPRLAVTVIVSYWVLYTGTATNLAFQASPLVGPGAGRNGGEIQGQNVALGSRAGYGRYPCSTMYGMSLRGCGGPVLARRPGGEDAIGMSRSKRSLTLTSSTGSAGGVGAYQGTWIRGSNGPTTPMGFRTGTRGGLGRQGALGSRMCVPGKSDGATAEQDTSDSTPNFLDGSTGKYSKVELKPRRALVTQPLSPWEHEFIETWRYSTPQRTIYKQGFPRDRWVPLKVPKDFQELSELIKSDAFNDVVQDVQKRNYWIYATGRTIFFFLSSLANVLSQIQVKQGANPIENGKKFRTEFAAAMKRVAMSGSRKDVKDSATRIPSMQRVRILFGSIFELYRRDCNNIFYGVYRSPYDASLRHRQFDLTYVRAQFEATVRASKETGLRRGLGRAGMIEVRNVLQRREADLISGVVLVDDPFQDDANVINDLYLLGNLSQYPRYYLQNFHWQTDGWLSTASAKAYEYTTESLFSGVQDAMQRQGFISISEFVSLRKGIVEEEDIRLLEVACGTGRLHTFVKDNWPKLDTTATDLSPYYLQEARDNMDYFIEFTERTSGRVVTPPKFVQCRAEDMPFEDSSYDIVTCTYLFHEIPMKIRHRVADEMFRVCKPGGIVVITDSFQKGDQPDKDHVGLLFPSNYHEPFYLNYFYDTDLVGLFLSKGFTFKRHQIAHLSKVLTFEKSIQEPTNGTTTLRRGGGTWAIV